MMTILIIARPELERSRITIYAPTPVSINFLVKRQQKFIAFFLIWWHVVNNTNVFQQNVRDDMGQLFVYGTVVITTALWWHSECYVSIKATRRQNQWECCINLQRSPMALVCWQQQHTLLYKRTSTLHHVIAMKTLQLHVVEKWCIYIPKVSIPLPRYLYLWLAVMLKRFLKSI